MNIAKNIFKKIKTYPENWGIAFEYSDPDYKDMIKPIFKRNMSDVFKIVDKYCNCNEYSLPQCIINYNESNELTMKIECYGDNEFKYIYELTNDECLKLLSILIKNEIRIYDVNNTCVCVY